MYVSILLPTKETPCERMEDYPYVAMPKLPKIDHNEHAIRQLLDTMQRDSKVVLSAEIENIEIVVARLADHEIRRRLGTRLVHGAAYYDASGLPIRFFYRGSTDGDWITSPLKVFARRAALNDSAVGYVPQGKEQRDKKWKKWDDEQAKPSLRDTSHPILPTHGVFPRCVQLLTAPPTLAGTAKGSSPIDKWLHSNDFTIETDPVPGSGVKMEWTQEEIMVNPEDPVFSLTYRPDKVQVKLDDREDGSPSSPLVTLLRRNIVKNGQKIGHPAFFFLRIEKVGEEYVPWRGPPDAPRSPPGGGVSSSFSLGRRRSYSNDYANALTPRKSFIHGM